MKYLLLSILLISFISCKPAEKKAVGVSYSSYLSPMEVTINPGLDLGEAETSNVSKEVSITVKNNSEGPLTELEMNIGEGQNYLKFQANATGARKTPGAGGSCLAKLAAKASCTFKVSYTPVKPGLVSVPIQFKYTNFIQPASMSLTFKALVGEAAELSFKENITTYDMGIQEQTDTSLKTLNLEVINNGDLTAREFTTKLTNIEAGQAYQILRNTCPVALAGKAKCFIDISYTPRNNQPNDTQLIYTANVGIDYLKNQDDLSGKLSANLTFLSARIEANFTPATITNLNFSNIVVGNKASKSFKIQNVGSREGLVQSLVIGSDVECSKAPSGIKLLCKKNGTNVTQEEFPFFIEDTDNCMNTNVSGVVGKNSGGVCNFNITYWPSVAVPAGGSFPATDIFVKYDSKWKNETGHIFSKKIATLPALTYSGIGFLTFDHVEVTPPGQAKLPDIIPQIATPYYSSLGDIPIFNSATNTNVTYSAVKMYFKNIGFSPVKVKKITDNATVPITIIPGVTGAISTGFYLKMTQSSCDNVAVGANCILSFNLAPSSQVSTAVENEMMFDFIDAMMPSVNYKQFNLTYNNGISYDNTGVAVPDIEFSAQLRANLIRNGFLKIQEAAFSYQGLAGTVSEKVITLQNLGTGDLLIPSASNQYLNPPSPASDSWGTRLVDNTGSPDNCGIYTGVDKILTANQICTVKMRFEIPQTARNHWPSSNTGGYWWHEHYRSFVNQNEYNDYLSGNLSLTFRYLTDPLNAATLATTNSVDSGYIFFSEAHIVPQKPLPMVSGLLIRPPITYTSLAGGYPTAYSLPVDTLPEMYFDSNTLPYKMSGPTKVQQRACPTTVAELNNRPYESCFNKMFKSPMSIDHVKNLSGAQMTRVAGEYIFHAGTFPVGETSILTLGFLNTGRNGATSVQMIEEGDNTIPIKIVGTTPPALSSGATISQPRFRFTPTTDGTFSRCYELRYFSGLSNRATRVCVYAEAVYPDLIGAETKMLKIEHSGNGVDYSDITSPLNSIDESKYASFFVVNGSGLNVLKRIKVTNNRNVSINMMNYNYMETTTSTPKNLLGTISSPNIKILSNTSTPVINLNSPVVESNPVCTADMTLASGTSCVFDILYNPSSAEGQIRNYIGITFALAPNQYVYYTGALSFRSAPPTTLSMINVSFSSAITPTATTVTAITDTTTTPRTVVARATSYPISLNKDPINPKKFPFALTNADATTPFEIIVKNETTLKTSFMAAFTNLYGAAAFPTDAYIHVFQGPTANIYANRYCFFGDDEGNNSIPYAFKGFYKDSQNACKMRVEFKGYRTYSGAACALEEMGGTISDSCNPFSYQIPFTTTEGLSLVNSNFNVHMQGYMEPNGVGGNIFQIQGVVAKNNGSVKLELPSITPNNLNRGSIQTSILCYDKDYLKLSSEKVYNLINDYTYAGSVLTKVSNTAEIENCLAFDDSMDFINVAGLSPSTYYFFKIFSLRKLIVPGENNLEYISKSSIPTLTAVVPGVNQIYDHNSKVLIDRAMKSQMGTRTQAISLCEADSVGVDLVGVKRNIPKRLINTTNFNTIVSTPDSSIGYPNEGVGVITHWLSDSAYDISNSISLYDGATVPGFANASLLDGNDDELKASFHKVCNNSASCNQLYKLVGGDPGEGFYMEGVFYTTANGINASARCFAELVCPTNPIYSINSASCAQP